MGCSSQLHLPATRWDQEAWKTGPATTFGHYLRYYKENTGLFSVAAWLYWESRLQDCAHLPPAPTSA